MRRARRIAVQAVLATLAAPLARMSAAADAEWPGKPIRLVVPTPAGSSMDVGARLLAEMWRTSLGPVVVENRPGADGIIGSRLVAQAAPDGCTLLVASNGQMSLTPLMHEPPPYDFDRDFTPVAMIARWPLVLVVTPTLPVATLAEFVAYAKARPDALNYGSASANYVIATERAFTLAGIHLRQIPYGGVAAVANALVAGDVHAAVINVIHAAPLVKAGKLRGLAVNAEVRQPLLPDVPTFAEAGMPRYDFAIWSGIYGPAGVPAPIVARLQAATAAVVRQPDVATRLAAAGNAPAFGGPREMRALIEYERDTFGALARTLRPSQGKDS